MNLSSTQQQFLLDLARSAILNTLSGRSSRAPAAFDPLLRQPCGCFVTLHEAATHRLRGCIGRIQSPEPLVVNVHESALGALQDPRFRSAPITLAELQYLDLEVSVLSPLTPAAHVLDFEPRENGIMLVNQGRTGTFLPQVGRETGWAREQLLTRLCSEKMGLAPEAWKEPAAKLFKYTALVIGPVMFLDANRPALAPAVAAVAPAVTMGLGGNRFTM